MYVSLDVYLCMYTCIGYPPRSIAPSWRTLTQPALMPLSVGATIPKATLSEKFFLYNYSIDLSTSIYPDKAACVREMLNQRQSQYFQIVQTEKDAMSSDHTFSVLSSDQLHVIKYEPIYQTVHVTRYEIKSESQSLRLAWIPYTYFIWNPLLSSFVPSYRHIRPSSEQFQWSIYDRLICGVDKEADQEMRFRRIRMAILPIQVNVDHPFVKPSTRAQTYHTHIQYHTHPSTDTPTTINSRRNNGRGESNGSNVDDNDEEYKRRQAKVKSSLEHILVTEQRHIESIIKLISEATKQDPLDIGVTACPQYTRWRQGKAKQGLTFKDINYNPLGTPSTAYHQEALSSNNVINTRPILTHPAPWLTTSNGGKGKNKGVLGNALDYPLTSPMPSTEVAAHEALSCFLPEVMFHVGPTKGEVTVVGDSRKEGNDKMTIETTDEGKNGEEEIATLEQLRANGFSVTGGIGRGSLPKDGLSRQTSANTGGMTSHKGTQSINENEGVLGFARENATRSTQIMLKSSKEETQSQIDDTLRTEWIKFKYDGLVNPYATYHLEVRQSMWKKYANYNSVILFKSQTL